MKRVSIPCLAAVTPGLLVVALATPGAAPQEKAPAGTEAKYEPRPQGSVTFSEHIAPILFEHCTPCHRSGEAGPFPLTTYQESRRRGRLLGLVAKDRFMPPWLPEPGYGEFSNSRALSEEEIGLLVQWSRERTPPGDLEEVPPLPDFSLDWELGPPDLVLKARHAFEMPADAVGITRNFVFPTELDQDRWIRAVDLKPSSNTVLRALLHVRPATDSGAEIDPTDLGVVLDAPELGFAPVAGLGGEIVETSPSPFPDGTAQLLARGSTLILQVYFEPTGETEVEQPEIGLYFAAGPPSRQLVTLSLGTLSLDIPAGESAYTVTSSFTLPVAAQAVGVLPHAHRIARQVRAGATLPDGSRKWLLSIPRWDFTWQQPYWFKEPLLLPAGSVVEMKYVYDNTDENENNFNYPAARVTWGQTLKGEMAGLHLRLVLDEHEDLGKLETAYGDYLRAAGLVGPG